MGTSGRMAGQETRLADQGACPRQPGHLACLPAQALPPDLRPTGPDRSTLPAEKPKPPAQLEATWMTPPVQLVTPRLRNQLGRLRRHSGQYLAQSSRYSRSSRVHGISTSTQEDSDQISYQLQDMHLEEVSTPLVPPGAMTRSRSRALFHKFCLWVDKLQEDDRQGTLGQKCKEESKGFTTMQGTSETWALVARESGPKDS
ncbi:hypothetical protein BSL78_28301 [Apostichopus japonicus]|uniref:Uncharacterized protein n=1 Tax=Stichopus japonicus TaxID=307972 RepID=A0A2G8JGH9_STIJA|nr:hypothetical protein BSL78_28301 [Apostichopus japonicus]